MKSYGLFFDLDGTLVDTLPDIAGVINQIRTGYQLPVLPESQVATFVGRGVEYLIAGCLPERTGQVPMAELVNAYRVGFLASPPAGRLYPGVTETLRALRERGVCLGVVTNRLTALAKKTLELYLPSIQFEVVLGPDLVPRPKPDPIHLRIALEMTGIAKEDACFVGDHEVDLACARAAGVAFRGAVYGLSGVWVRAEERLSGFTELMERLPWQLA